MRLPITAIILTKNEEQAIGRSLAAVEFCEQVIVVDSNSTDQTEQIALTFGAEVVQFAWSGTYPKKKEWSLRHPSVRHDWVLLLDADEIITEELQREIRSVTTDPAHTAYDIPLSYVFAGRELRHGHRVFKRSFFDRRETAFPVVDDLGAPGITEVEGHYQPVTSGSVGSFDSPLIHDDPDPVTTWFSRHNKYSDWEAHLATHGNSRAEVRRNRTRRGQIFDRLPFRPMIFFIYCYVLRAGFRDGRAGFDYAFGLAWYYWSIGVKTREIRRDRQFQTPSPNH